MRPVEVRWPQNYPLMSRHHPLRRHPLPSPAKPRTLGSPSYPAPPPAKKRNGCLIAVLIVVGIFVLLMILGLAVFGLGGVEVETSSGTTPASAVPEETTASTQPQETKAPATEPPTTEPPPAANLYSYGDTVIISEVEATALAPVEDTEAPFKGDGNKVMVFDVTLVNKAAEPRTYNSLAFEAFDADGYKYTAFGATSKQSLSSGTVSPGQKVRGFVAYEVPSGATLERLVWTPDIFGGAQATWR